MWKSFSLILAAAALLVPHSARAWGGAGHQLIAAEAYRQLSPQLKAETFATLQAHPNFTKWTNTYRPNATFDLAAYVFMRSATWPDEIRRSDSQYDHPEWHFIDYPLRLPNFAFELDARPTNNLLAGIAESEQALSHPQANPEYRAAMLSYLVHLIADEHQPMHCESFYTAAITNGDRGGNDVYVKPAGPLPGGTPQGVRLHGLWDSLLGSALNPRLQWNSAIELQTRFPRTALPELIPHTTPQAWSLESRELAINQSYLRGTLPISTSQDDAPALPADYLNHAKAVAEKQAALAGYRLADEIRTYLKCAGQIPLLPENTFNPALAKPIGKIGTTQASQYYNETMTVTGKVVGISFRPSITILDLDKAYPNTQFTAVIFPENAAKFPDLKSLNHHTIEITGPITEYHQKPQIILDSPTQLKITDPQ